jgi:flagella basal body P-ring formation protein FlgA
MMNPRPLGARKTVQLLVALTLLAWATQTLFHQWGYGGLILPAEFAGPPPLHPQPAQAAIPSQRPDITLELRSQIRAVRNEVTLSDVCRWSGADAIAMEPVADLVLTRVSDAAALHTVSVDQLKSALQDAGVNVATVRFSGAATCAVVVGDADLPPPVAAAKPVVETAQTTLKDLLLATLHERLKLSAKQVQVDFDAKDASILALTTPRYRIDFDDHDAAELGAVQWKVVIQTDAGDRTETIRATARKWEDQLVLTRGLSRGQGFMKGDVRHQRVLVDKPTTNPAPADEPVVGQLASRDLKRGDVLAAGDTTAPQIVRAGQFMTVALRMHDGQTVQTTATALDGGGEGAVIRARNTATGETYHVRITEPDAGEITTDVASITN